MSKCESHSNGAADYHELETTYGVKIRFETKQVAQDSSCDTVVVSTVQFKGFESKIRLAKEDVEGLQQLLSKISVEL